MLLVQQSHGQDPVGETADGIEPESDPPALVLRTPRLDGPSYAELEPGHRLYGVAAWAWHADRRGELRGELRRGLFTALQEAWPTTRGDKKEREHRSLVALRAHDAGASIDEVAEAFCVRPDTARRWIRGARLDFGPGCDFEPRIELAWSSRQPADPSRPTPLELARSMARPSDQLARMEDDRRRADL